MANGVDLGTREVRHTLRPADCDKADPRFADRPGFAAYCEAVKEWRADVAKLRELFTADEIEKEWSDALDASADAWSAVADAEVGSLTELADKIDLCMGDRALAHEDNMELLLGTVGRQVRRFAQT